MPRRKLNERATRNIQKNQGTYSVSLPIDEIRTLGWRERQKVVVRRVGKRIIIEDWK